MKRAHVAAWAGLPATNPEAARRLVAALHDAAVWGDDARNHAQSAAILQKWLPFPAGLAEKMHRAYYGQMFDVAAMQPLLDFAYAQKSLTSHVMARDLISPVALVR